MAEVKTEPDNAAEASVAGPSYASASMRSIELLSTPTLPPPFGPSSAYAQTSQARNWRFSPSTLSSIRASGNQAARRRLESLWNEENASTSASTSIPFLSVSDELALITYYLNKVTQITNALRLPELVESTAITYVKRFYLTNTCMDFHPKNIVITCIFLASKAENYPLNLKDFARKLAGKAAGDAKAVEENRKIVLELEFLVSQSLKFEYGVRGALRGLYGLMLDLQQSLDGGLLGREKVHKLAADAHAKLAQARLTDAEFIYTPSQIALACLWAVEGGKEIVSKWLDVKESRARTVALGAKARRQALRESETARAAKAKIAQARRTKGKAGAKAAEDELAAASSNPAPVVEFEDELISSQPLGMGRDELEKVLGEIEALISARETGGFTGKGKGAEDVERVKEIDMRQKQCMNPEKVPGSRLYKKRQAQEEGASGGTSGGKRIKRENGVDSDDDDDAAVPVAEGFAVKPEPKV
ncbi:related to Cyclin H [Ustilago trichophora]|uniref:Related to Cyclin H n=1 Tax=Ustilago trichophora TaxID=86804 RepID=A0A5C3E7V8_9BASI|nr:related to Cyclin H [Ustilago trichophora]